MAESKKKTERVYTPTKKTVRNTTPEITQKYIDVCCDFFEKYSLTADEAKALDFLIDSVEKVANEGIKVSRKKRVE